MPPLVYLAARPRHGKLVAFLAAFFALTSFQIIDLSCEARGYSLGMAFAAGAWVCCGRYLRSRCVGAAVAFWGCCALGFLSQLTFLYAYTGFVFWSAWEMRQGSWVSWWRGLIVLHFPVVVGLAWLWIFDLRFFHYIGGPHLTLHELYAMYMSQTFNIPGGWENSLGVVTLILMILGIVLMVRRGKEDWPLYVGVIVCMAWAIDHRISANVAPRYLVLGAPFLMVPLGVVLESVAAGPSLRSGGALPPQSSPGVPGEGEGRVGLGDAAVFCAAILFGVGGVWRGAEVFCGDRHGYVEAIEFMARNSRTPVGTVDCGWDDYVNALTFDFYCKRAGEKSLWPGVAPAQWWVTGPLVDAERIRRGEHAYRLVEIFPNRGAGAGWNLYEIDDQK